MQGIVTFRYRKDLKEFFNSLPLAILQEYYNITGISFFVRNGEVHGLIHSNIDF